MGRRQRLLRFGFLASNRLTRFKPRTTRLVRGLSRSAQGETRALRAFQSPSGEVEGLESIAPNLFKASLPGDVQQGGTPVSGEQRMTTAESKNFFEVVEDYERKLIGEALAQC